jgi:hypothetical protein
MSAPYPNCTYSVPFYGPSLSCGAPIIGNSSFQEDIWSLINNTTCSKDGCSGASIIYISYVPQIGKANSTLPAAALLGLNDTLSLFDTNIASAANLYAFDEVSVDHARIFATIPKLGSNEMDLLYQPSGYQTIECGLYNTSYVANFTFINGQQDIKVTNMTQLNGVSYQLSYSICGESEDASEPCSGPVLGYMSILDALDNILMGFLTNDQYQVIGSFRTQITNTVLMETMELQGLQRGGTNDIKGLSEPLSISNMTMSDALEQIILNTTLSLFSDPYFL